MQSHDVVAENSALFSITSTLRCQKTSRTFDQWVLIHVSRLGEAMVLANHPLSSTIRRVGYKDSLAASRGIIESHRRTGV